jgi:hypothetical protein
VASAGGGGSGAAADAAAAPNLNAERVEGVKKQLATLLACDAELDECRGAA